MILAYLSIFVNSNILKYYTGSKPVANYRPIASTSSREGTDTLTGSVDSMMPRAFSTCEADPHARRDGTEPADEDCALCRP